MIVSEIIGIILGSFVAILTAIRKFNIRHIRIKCWSACCGCEEEMLDEKDE